MPTPAALFAMLIFGLAGLVAFTYGKKNALWRPMLLGLSLIVYPYFVEQTWLMYAVGGALCAALVLWRGD